MLQELLLALIGHTGDFILETQSDQCGGQPFSFQLAPDLSFIKPAERVAIERLLPLGVYYRVLDDFVSRHRRLRSKWIFDEKTRSLTSNQSGKDCAKPSIYRKALANGVAETLSLYRSAVLKVEQQLLSHPLPILTSVTQGVHEFNTLLGPLCEFVMHIEHNDVRGGQLLDLLCKRCHCGAPMLQTCMQRLLWHGRQVMYRQLLAWMVHGILQDHYGEFFIRRHEDGDPEHEYAVETLKVGSRKSAEDPSITDWHVGFHVSLDMLPEHIDIRIAESILFSGKAVRVLRNPSPAFRPRNDLSQARGAYKWQAHFSLQKDAFMDTEVVGEDLFPQSESEKIVTMLQELQRSPEFHKRSFEQVVEATHAIAATHLWQLVAVYADLSGHLKALKDYFLLAKGDFFQCFLEESHHLLHLPPRYSTAESDLLVPFQLAASNTIGDDDKYFSRVSLRFSAERRLGDSNLDISNLKIGNDEPTGATLEGAYVGPSLDGWDAISLDYSVSWPLQLFFTQEVLSKYRRIFQYLLRLKRTQMELERAWASVMHQDHVGFSKRKKDPNQHSVSQQYKQQFRPMWRIREHMAFLITNLQFYIQVDVIESQWNLLQNRLQESHDFTKLVVFHQEYLSALISQSFLDIGSVSRILDGIMKLCLQFCWCMEGSGGYPNESTLKHISEEFNKKSNSLYTILRSSKLAGSQRAPFLRQFLLRLNFNSLFEATAKGALNVVRQRPVGALQL